MSARKKGQKTTSSTTTIQNSDAYFDGSRYCQRLRGATKETFFIGELTEGNESLHFIVDWGSNVKF